HPRVDPYIFSLNLERRCRRFGLQHKVVIAMWAVLVCIFPFPCIFAEALFALFACECLVKMVSNGGAMRAGQAGRFRETGVPCRSAWAVRGLLTLRGIPRSQTTSDL